MNSDTTERKLGPFALLQGCIPAPPSGRSEVLELTHAGNGATLSTGLVTFRDIETAPWTVWYDEVLALHATEGEFEIEFDGTPHPMQVGDFVWVRAGSTIVYRARGGSSTLFFAVVPADWAARGKPA